MERRTFIQTLLLSSGYVMLGPSNLLGLNTDKNIIKIAMIYNNTGYSTGLKSAWGLSVWIEQGNSAVLFDTGGDSSILNDNITKTGIDLDKLTCIVISHKHWDHVKGINSILEKKNYKPEVYVVEETLNEFKTKIPEATFKSILNSQQIVLNIWTTGQLKGSMMGTEIFEQAVILAQDDSIVVITGCSHPGIVQMVKAAREAFPAKKIELIAGGFHLLQTTDGEIMQISKGLRALGVKKIAPSHCTGDKAINYFKADWGKQFIDFNLGSQISL